MSGFPILDLVVGMIFIFFLLSVITSSLIEILLNVMDARAKLLQKWAVKIFDKKVVVGDRRVELGQAILDHCAVTALTKSNRSPSYVDAKNFTSALIEKITFDPANPNSIAKDIDSVVAAINNTEILSTEIKRSLLGFANDVKQAAGTATASVMDFRNKVESWYDSSMDRLTGALKRRYISWLTFTVATVFAISMNADSVAIAKFLYSNPEARAELAASAMAAAQDSAYMKRLTSVRATGTDSASLDTLRQNLSGLIQNVNEAKAAVTGEVPLGWRAEEIAKLHGWNLLAKITGLFGTILAIVMGAPFWFDILNKIANLRSSGPKPPSSTSPTT